MRAFHVVSHGWHTGIVVSRRDLIGVVPELAKDFGSGEYIEVGWGDERFYQAQKVTLTLALRAIFWPTSSVLHVVAVPYPPRRFFPESEVVEVSVPRAGYEKLLVFLAGSFTRTYDNDIVRLGSGLYGDSRFYRAEGNFHAFNTCNTWVAASIEKTGYPISSAGTLTAKGVLSRLHRGNDADRDCYAAQ